MPTQKSIGNAIRMTVDEGHLAGAAALVLTARPQLGWLGVREFLQHSATKIDAGNNDLNGKWQDLDGDGIKEFSRFYGYGRLDVDAAVAAALDITKTS